MKKILRKLCSVTLAVLMLLSALVVPSVTVSAEEVFILPDSVDNSTSPYFPAIGNQGSMGSCSSWAHVYYSFTYAVNKSRGIKTTPEKPFLLSGPITLPATVRAKALLRPILSGF